MTERFLSSATSELEFTKKHIASLSGVPGGVSYNRDFALQTEERERKVPISQVVLARPPEPIAAEASASTSTSTSGAVVDPPSISLTVKSLKPPLSFTLTNCSLTATIASLKDQLHAQHKAKGAPEADRQRWLFKGKAMADERLLKEYDGLKDGDTVHLSMKAGTAANSASSASAGEMGPPAVPSASTATPSTTVSSPKDKLPSLNTSTNGTTTAAAAAPKPFSFTSSTLSTEMPSPSRGRTTSTSSLSSSRNGAGAHARVPSITLTTDIVNFSNLASSPIDESMSPANVSASTNGSNVPAYSPPISGASTPKSAPGTPISGPMGRTKSPSISIPIDLDNIELMNPKSDRRGSIGLSPRFTNTMKDPQVWLDVLDFLDSKFRAEGAPSRSSEEDYMPDSKRAFETWLGASKEFMTPSDIARIRDTTGVWAMAGH